MIDLQAEKSAEFNQLPLLPTLLGLRSVTARLLTVLEYQLPDQRLTKDDEVLLAMLGILSLKSTTDAWLRRCHAHPTARRVDASQDVADTDQSLLR